MNGFVCFSHRANNSNTFSRFSQLFKIYSPELTKGLCRNCGVYDFGLWVILKALRMDSGPFPLKSVEFLEELATIAGVDSVSEILATLGLLSLVSEEVLAGLVPDAKACGMFNPCDENGEPELDVGEIFLTCTLAFFFRAVFFCMERSVFKSIMRYASSIEANAQIMSNSLTTFSSLGKKTVIKSSTLSKNVKKGPPKPRDSGEESFDKSSLRQIRAAASNKESAVSDDTAPIRGSSLEQIRVAASNTESARGGDTDDPIENIHQHSSVSKMASTLNTVDPRIYL